MVSALVKNMFREIRSSLGRFFSIFAIVVLGTGFLTGLMVATPDMKLSMDRYFDDTGMMDLCIKASLGLGERDAEALRGLDVVDRLSPAKVMDARVSGPGGGSFMARFYGLALDKALAPGAVNRLELVSGRAPERAGECLADGGGDFAALEPGSVIRIPEQKAGESEIFAVREYTVTGTVRSPLFVSAEKEKGMDGSRISAVLYVHQDAFALPFYTDFFITCTGAKALTAFTPAYQELVDAAASVLKAMEKRRAPLREAEVRALAEKEAREKFVLAESEYRGGREQAEREFAAARRRFDEAEDQLAAAEEELARGEETLAGERLKTMAEIAGGEQAMREGEAELDAARAVLDEAKARLDENRARVEKTRASRLGMLLGKGGVERFDRAERQYQEGRDRLLEETQKLEEGKRRLEEGRIAAEAAFAEAETRLASGRAELEQGREQTLGGRAEFERRRIQGEEELSLAEEKLRQGREDARHIEIPENRWYVLDRGANLGAVVFGMNIEKIADISRIFPFLFMLVAALVVFVTMTRMIEEDRLQIGALKSLGYRKRLISMKYLVYCGITGAAGSAAGVAAGFRVLPVIIHNAFGSIYHMPPPFTPVNWKLGVFSCALALLSMSGVTLASCSRSLREKPAELLRPRAPKPGKRVFLEYIPVLWKPMKFTWKITARNILRYKTHFAMTVTGIAGCTALMLTAFGIRDSLVDIARTQFSSILKYDLRIELKESPDPALEKILSEYGEKNGGRAWTALSAASGFVVNGRSRYGAEIYTPETEEHFGEFIALKNRKTGRSLPFSPDSVIITEKIAELLGTGAGGNITLEDASGKTAVFTVGGVTENYVGLPVYLGKTVRETLFGPPSFHTLLVKSGMETPGENAARESGLARLLSCDSAAGAEFTSSVQESWERLLSSINYVVLVLIAAAAGLGGTVLFNLINININERRTELAALRVLGFRRGETAAWIFREISVLVLAGAASGLALGIPLHRLIISIAENPDLMFGRGISPGSFALSFLFTLAFSVLVDVCMLPKIKRINMAESLKAPD